MLYVGGQQYEVPWNWQGVGLAWSFKHSSKHFVIAKNNRHNEPHRNRIVNTRVPLNFPVLL